MSREVTGVAYVSVFVALIVLATVSLGISFLHWGTGGIVFAVGIAVVKAGLVLWFFMHLAEQRFTNRMTVVVSVMFVALLVGLTAADVATRRTVAQGTRPPAGERFYER